jgi:peptidoglycan/LPS O-acetylase OafA/YrhL
MKPSSEHIPFLDYLRGIAILAVFLYHATAPEPNIFSFGLPWHGWLRDFHIPFDHLVLFPFTLGWAGVAIFFVVSGFCIHLSHEKSRDKDFGVFFLRRFFRIYPPYLAALLFFALIFPVSKLDFSPALIHTHSQRFFSLFSLGGHLAILHNWSGTIAWDISGPFWSIAVEVQLYLLYPLLLVLTRRGWTRALWITAAIELSLRALASLTHIEASWLVLNPLYFWFSWSVGAALAEAYLKGQSLPFTGRSLLFFPVLMVVFSLIKPLAPFCFTLAALSTVCLMSYWLRHPAPVPAPSTRGNFWLNHLRFAGLVSYSFYLIHEPLLRETYALLATYFPGRIPYLELFTICALMWFVILIPSYAFYRALELPSIALGKRVIEARRRRKAGPASIPLAPAGS